MRAEQAASFPPPPRVVRQRASAGLLGPRLIASLLLLAVLVMAGLWSLDALVQLAGEPVSAEVTSKRTSRGRRSSSYYIAYRYRVGDAWFTDEDSVRRVHYDSISSRHQFPAQTFQIMGHRTASLMLGRQAYWERRTPMAILTVVIIVIAAVSTKKSWIDPARAKRLLRDGQITTGAIVRKFTRTHKRSTSYHVAFAYYPPGRGDEPCEITTRTSGETYRYAGEGDQVTVFHDPARPRRAVAYELCDFEIDGSMRYSAPA